MLYVNEMAEQTHRAYHLSLLGNSITYVLICECCAVSSFSNVSLRYQTEIHGADTNNLFTAIDKDQHDCVHIKSFQTVEADNSLIAPQLVRSTSGSVTVCSSELFLQCRICYGPYNLAQVYRRVA